MKARMNDFLSFGIAKLAALLFFTMVVAWSGSAAAELVTVWEDQFTSINAGWDIPDEGIEFVSQAVPLDVVGSEDGFEARFTNTTGLSKYLVFSIPANLVQQGDRLEYSFRSDFYNHYAGDRINLVAEVGDAFDSGFVNHDSPGALTYLKEPGNLFDVFDTTLMQPLRPTNNLYFGNNGYGGEGVESTFYVDFIRIVGERTALAGDYNRNGSVDAADYTAWRDTFGQNVDNGTGADGDQNGVIEENDYSIWKSNFTAGSGQAALASATVPEPGSLCLLLTVLLWSTARRNRRSTI